MALADGIQEPFVVFLIQFTAVEGSAPAGTPQIGRIQVDKALRIVVPLNKAQGVRLFDLYQMGRIPQKPLGRFRDIIGYLMPFAGVSSNFRKPMVPPAAFPVHSGSYRLGGLHDKSPCLFQGIPAGLEGSTIFLSAIRREPEGMGQLLRTLPKHPEQIGDIPVQIVDRFDTAGQFVEKDSPGSQKRFQIDHLLVPLREMRDDPPGQGP